MHSKHKILIIITIAITVLINTSCKKESSNPATKTNLLCSGKWICTEWSSEPSGLTLDECLENISYLYKLDNVLILDQESDECSEIDQQTNKTWSFNEAETILTLNTGENSIEANIIELTSTRLRFWIPIPLNGNIYKLNMTYSH